MYKIKVKQLNQKIVFKVFKNYFLGNKFLKNINEIIFNKTKYIIL